MPIRDLFHPRLQQRSGAVLSGKNQDHLAAVNSHQAKIAAHIAAIQAAADGEPAPTAAEIEAQSNDIDDTQGTPAPDAAPSQDRTANSALRLALPPEGFTPLGIIRVQRDLHGNTRQQQRVLYSDGIRPPRPFPAPHPVHNSEEHM